MKTRKDKERAEVKAAVQDFLNRGGKIKRIEPEEAFAGEPRCFSPNLRSQAVGWNGPTATDCIRVYAPRLFD
jgi:hypothetical protein